MSETTEDTDRDWDAVYAKWRAWQATLDYPCLCSETLNWKGDHWHRDCHLAPATPDAGGAKA